MSNLIAKWQGSAPYLHSALRIMAAFMFMLSGTTKLFEWPGGMPPGVTIPMWSQIWIGAVLEVVGGGLLLIGFFTRPTAFLLSGMMAVAYFQFHFPAGFWPTVNGGVSAALYCFVWLYFSAAGSGPWSVDAKQGQ